MVRNKLAAAILTAGFLLPGLASALGVGDYTLKSYLNQPLELEIDLIQTKELTPDEVIAALASQDEFSRAGVDRLFFLTDIRFEIQQRPDGHLVVVARSSKPVTEPFLNFLMEVQWPQGRMLREYTILLDPPLYKTGAAPTATSEPVVVSQPPPAPEPAPVVAAPLPPPVVAAPLPPPVDMSLPPPPSGVVARGSEPAPRPMPAPEQPAAAAGDYRVQANDTMWEIAARHRGTGTVQQTMMAIQRANQDAFIKGNVNLVKKGYVLRIPGETEVQQISTDEARNAFATQTRAWREMLDSRAAALPSEHAQLEAGKTATARAPAKKGTGAGEVTLVAPTASAKGGKAASGKELDALQNQLAIAEEGLDKSARENKELASRLGDLDKQVKASDKLLAMKNDQISDLQGELNRLRKEKGLPPVEAPKPADAAAAVDAAAATATAAPETAQPVADATAQAPKPVRKEIREKPKKVDQAPVANEGGSSMMLPLAGLLALLVAGAAGFMFWRKKQGAGKTTAVSAGYAGEDAHEAQVADDLAQLQDLNLGSDEDHEPEDRGAVHAEGGESSDPLGEADMYMAYGRFQHAADILYAALQREPERDDIRVKLAEVYAEMGDTDSAREQAQAVADSGDGDVRRQAAAVLARVGGGAAVAGAEAEEQLPSLDDLALEFSGGKPDQGAGEDLSFDLSDDAALPTAADESLEFSLDDFADTGAKTGVGPKEDLEEFSLEDADMGDFSLAEETPAAAPADEFSLEDEFSLDEAPAAAPQNEGFDLSDEFALADEVDFAATPAPVAELADDLSLEEEVAPAAAPAAAPAVAADAGLDLESELADLQSDLSGEGMGGAESSAGGDDFDFLADSDENATKLDLAKAYIDMGDAEGARDILNEVVAEGNATQKAEAQKLLASVA